MRPPFWSPCDLLPERQNKAVFVTSVFRTMSTSGKKLDTTFIYAPSDDKEAAQNLLSIFKILFFYDDNARSDGDNSY